MSEAAIIAGAIGILVTILSIVAGLKWAKQEHLNAIVIGGVTLVITTVVALGAELLDYERSERDLIAQMVPTINNRTWRGVVANIAEYDQRLSRRTPNGFEDIIHERLRRSIEQSLSEARDGDIAVKTLAETVELTSMFLDQARHTVVATSYVAPDDWWDGEVSRAYGEAMARVRGHIQSFDRIFIVGPGDDLAKLARISALQKAAGVDVMFLCEASIEPEERQDFIVIDSKVAALLELGEGRHFRQAHFYPTETKSVDYEERFRLLKLRANKGPPDEKLCTGRMSAPPIGGLGGRSAPR